MIEGAAGFSGIGARPSNEDRYAFWWAGDTFSAAVADGLGGMGGGDYASSYAVDHLRGRAIAAGMAAGDLADLVLECHAGIRQQQRQHRDRGAMATTLTVICVAGEKLVAAHCGDTRLLVASCDGVTQLSQDHSVAARMFRQGLLSADDFAHHPGKNMLESALGIPDLPVVQKIEMDVQPNDWLLIVSDGAYNRLDPDDIVRIGRSSGTPSRFAAACRSLVEARTPADNYTMVVARVRG
ncbi:MAG: PP2C family protein-serine/threonine phosphatase [Rhodanobacteraceae bacterium]